MPKQHEITPGEKVEIEKLSTRGRDFTNDREAAELEFANLREKIIEIQPRLYAERKQALLVVFQAMDAGGKDGTTRKVFSGVNPQGVKVVSFKAPSKDELAHDYLWRIHQQIPAKGMMTVFNRSHYEDLLVVRVDNLAPKSVWEKRYDHINAFEERLVDEGVTILKFFLHISKVEQKERFQDRLDEPNKNWKFDPGDLEKRKQWDAYQQAFEDVLERCSTKHAPWYAIPADQKWYRNLAISRVIVDTLKKMNPQFPEVDWNPGDFTIE